MGQQLPVSGTTILLPVSMDPPILGTSDRPASLWSCVIVAIGTSTLLYLYNAFQGSLTLGKSLLGEPKERLLTEAVCSLSHPWVNSHPCGRPCSPVTFTAASGRCR